VSFQPIPLDLVSVLKGTISDLAPGALAKGMDLELKHGRPMLVSGDAGLLTILFRNLIDNAIRYSPPATKIAIQIEAADDEELVRISDAGPGISSAERPNIGRRFYRAPGTQAPGSGLGLSIVQRILELHRGRMQFDAPPTGSGLHVTVALPRVRDARL
jgi:signal transduction histidine kinase